MNKPAITAEHYEPVRASDRTERARLVADVQQLERKFSDAQSRSEIAPDPSYGRLAYRLGKELDAARQKVVTFDLRQRELDEHRSSADAKAAGVKAAKVAAKFEQAILAAATAASELKESAATLADELQVRDPGVWPSRQTVDTAIRGRIIEILGNKAGIKLDGFGSVGRQIDSLTKRFESQQGE